MLKKFIILFFALWVCGIFFIGAIRNLPDRGIKILSPKADDILKVGTSFEIRWVADPELGKLVRIEFSKDGGRSWKTIAKGVSNNGIYLWKVPEVDSAHCKIRIFFQDKPRFRGTSEKFVIKKDYL
jgi:hypothetical protein